MRRAYQTDLSDEEWSCLEGYLPAPKTGGRPDLLTEVRADIPLQLGAPLSRRESEVAGLVEQVAGVKQASLVDEELAFLDPDAG